MSMIIFAFAAISTSGMDMFTGIDLGAPYSGVISSLGIIACGVGLLFSGKEYEDQMGFLPDDPVKFQRRKA